MYNQKYEITDIAHERYPFLHRIRALCDISEEVKAGDLGGYVQTEDNLSYEKDDTAWIFDNAIAAGESIVDKDAVLRDNAIVRDDACVTAHSVLTGNACVEDYGYVCNACVSESARVAGTSIVTVEKETGQAPKLSGSSTVYGSVYGNVQLTGNTVILGKEEIGNMTRDQLIINGSERSVIRDPSRDEMSSLSKDSKESPEKKNRGPNR